MPRRNSIQVPAIVAPGAASVAPPGGSPLGWTFWSTASTCWRKWFLRYVMNLFPVTLRPELAIGTVYHALQEGLTKQQICAWGEEFESAFADGEKAFNARTKNGPPLPEATAVEKTLNVPGLPMTSKPDREEGDGIVRDFKTAAFFSKNDDEYWNVNGGIIGEMVAANARECVVDVVNKADGKVQQISVLHTVEKEDALRCQVEELSNALMNRLSARRIDTSLLAKDFYKNLNGCVGKYGLCEYYERCWSKGVTRHMYKKVPTRAWAEAMSKQDAAVGNRTLFTPKYLDSLAAAALKEGV